MALKPVQVSQLNSYIKRILQTDPLLGNVSVIGEVSNLKFHSSGHVYFSLKDAGSRLNCFLPAERADKLRYELAEGMEITASGYIYLYERGGSYSLNVRDIEVSGLGDLSAAFEQLKQKLEKEGLFDAAHKKPLPAFPEKIAVITSESGAAVRDILKIIKSRNQYVDILIYPVLVQGPAAAGEIAAAIAHVNRDWPDIDIIITGRGGGAMEELWAFNEEVVARAIFASAIPVISAVGHETDFTIADFVADRRAETPTAAAHMAVPDLAELKAWVGELEERLTAGAENLLRRLELKLESLNLTTFRRELESRIVMEEMRLEQLHSDSRQRVENLLERYGQRLQALRTGLEDRNPVAIMRRGYGALLDKNGSLLGSVNSLHPRDAITVVLSDGRADCRVEKVSPAKG